MLENRDFNTPEEIERSKREVDEQLEHFKTGLYADVINAWPSTMWDEGHALHYEDYFRSRRHPEVADYIMSKSSPDKVKEFDKLVDEYNKDLDRMNAIEDKRIREKEKERFIPRLKILVLGVKSI